jgi:hypothetical protein
MNEISQLSFQSPRNTFVPKYSSKENVDDNNAFSSNANQVLGVGHLSILHAYVRDELFKNIKILSNHHLETKGEIMQHCMSKLNFTEKRDGNQTAFVNACRTEIRKTMCSRRGYVKRQIGLLLSGEIFIGSFKPYFDYLTYFILFYLIRYFNQ